MFNVVRNWAESHPDRHKLNEILGSESVRAGRNHILNESTKEVGCNHGSWGGHGKTAGSIWSEIKKPRLRGYERQWTDVIEIHIWDPIPPRIVRNPCLPKFDHR